MSAAENRLCSCVWHWPAGAAVPSDAISTIRSVTGEIARLSPVEFRLLRTIVRGGGESVTRAQLVRATWLHRTRVPAATVDSHVRSIRRKLAMSHIPLRIRTVRGIGFACA